MILNKVTQLPEGWVITTLGDVVEVLDNRRIPLNAKEREKRKGAYPYYGANGQVDSINDYLFDGDYVLIAEDGGYFDDPTRGVAYRVTGKFWVNNHAHIVSPLGSMSTQFFAYALNTVNWMQFVSGTTRLKLTQGSLIKIPLLLPPLNEQRRIVAKIEALRARSQQVKEALEAIPRLLDQFRQSVLAAAFRGDLTADWREQNPDVVEWERTTLQEVIKGKPRNGYSPKSVDYPTKVKSITLTATTSGKFKPEYFKYIDEEIAIDSYLWLSPGDILIQRSNTIEYVGTCAVYKGSFGEFIYPDLIMKIKVIEEKATPEFIYYTLSNKATRLYFQKNATGTAGNMPKINQPIVMNTPVSLPSIAEQKEIVRRVESFFKAVDIMKLQYQQIKSQLDQLNQSIFAKAFRGELVPQDPNDEPASLLLERIRAERAKLQIKTAKKSTTKTSARRTKKTQPQQEESVQLELGLE